MKIPTVKEEWESYRKFVLKDIPEENVIQLDETRK